MYQIRHAFQLLTKKEKVWIWLKKTYIVQVVPIFLERWFCVGWIAPMMTSSQGFGHFACSLSLFTYTHTQTHTHSYMAAASSTECNRDAPTEINMNWGSVSTGTFRGVRVSCLLLLNCMHSHRNALVFRNDLSIQCLRGWCVCCVFNPANVLLGTLVEISRGLCFMGPPC